MSRVKYKPEDIAHKLSNVRAATGAGASVSRAVREQGISEATYFRWRAEFRHMGAKQVVQLKQLEFENERLRRALQKIA
jgi:transposase-like protein